MCLCMNKKKTLTTQKVKFVVLGFHNFITTCCNTLLPLR